MNRIKELRKARKISQCKLAEMLNVHQTAISQWETGRTNPDIATAKKIADIFGTTTDYIFGREYDGNSKNFTMPKDLLKKCITPIEHYFDPEAISKLFEIIEKDETLQSYNENLELSFQEPMSPERTLKLEHGLSVTDENPDVVSYEVVGTVAAGYDGEAVEEYTGEICEIPTSYLKGHKKEDYFVLRVVGDSMYPRLLNGDRVLVQRCTSVDSGDIAIVMYNGSEATLKKVEYVNGENWVDLIPFNPEYPTKHLENEELEECRILGKVRVLLREL